MGIKSKFFAAFLIVNVALPALGVDRRKDQFPTDPSYLILPLPYSIPGIGSGLMLTGLAGKIMYTNMDFYAIQAFGDAEGTALGLKNIHLLNHLLILDLESEAFSKAAIQQYSERGMKTEKTDYRLVELNQIREYRAKLTLSLWERRLEIDGGAELFSMNIPRVRSSDGTVIAELDPMQKSIDRQTFAGVTLDLTDDHADPRRGFRIEGEASHSQRSSTADPDTFVTDITANAYVPLGRSSTWAFTAFKSDAHVTDSGQTEEGAIKEALGYACTDGDDECRKAEADAVSMQIAANRNGTASSIGGRSRLRSYPDNRFFSAHSAMLGTELRWNFIEGVTPFDFGIWNDIAAALQIVVFSEMGSVAEKDSEFGRERRVSSGTGFRMVSSSGMVYRADFAVGDEGSSFIIFFGYPW